jgi:hypothetical protein
MAGFRKAKAEQAALKIGMYGSSGTGKTFTSLLIAEGLAKVTGKRIAFVDTERGTDFYCKAVPTRRPHPEEFDFDSIYSRGIAEITEAVHGLDPNRYGVIVIDSITHIWEAARNAYDGRTTKIGTIPMQAWGKIKKPYKELIAFLLSSPMHVILCGREGNDYETDPDTDELKCVGTKMKAEGETPYEPHILIHLESKRDKKGNAIIQAFAEKDRTGTLAGKLINLWPSKESTFDLLAAPILPLLGGTQAKVETEDETGVRDCEALSAAEEKKTKASAEKLSRFAARLSLCESAAQVKAIGKEITPEVKKQMVSADVADLRVKYQEAEAKFKGNGTTSPEPAEPPKTITVEGPSGENLTPATETPAV